MAVMRFRRRRSPLVVVGVVLLLAGSLRMRAQEAMHRGDVVVSFGPQVLSWQELRAEMLLRSPGSAAESARERVERSSETFEKEGAARVASRPESHQVALNRPVGLGVDYLLPRQAGLQ